MAISLNNSRAIGRKAAAAPARGRRATVAPRAQAMGNADGAPKEVAAGIARAIAGLPTASTPFDDYKFERIREATVGTDW